MKKKKSAQRNTRGKERRKSEQGFTLFRHPFSTMDPAVVQAGLLEMADRKTGEFPTLVETVLQTFREKYPPHIIAVMAGYGLQTGVSEAGVSGKRLISKLEQHHLELLQSLLLTLPFDSWSDLPASPADIQKMINTIVDLADAFHSRRFKAVEAASDVQARIALALQERLRLHTQMVRNWGYFTEVVQISTELYTPLDELFRKALGFGASDLIAIGRYLVDTFEHRCNERFKRLKRIFREKTIPGLVRAYFEQQPEMKGDPKTFLRAIPEGTTREQVGYRLLSHADISFVSLMSFNPAETAQQSGIPLDVTKRVLGTLSLSPGDLCGQDPERLFMANPVWQSPAIEIGGEYFCPLPQSIFSHIHEIMRTLADKAGLTKALEARRATYLETKVKALLAQALPAAQLRHGVKWRFGDVEYETDHVAAIDRTLVIVEDKSAALTGPGLRGAPDRMRRHISDLIAAPSEQSERIEKMIWESKAGDGTAAACLAPFDLNFVDTERIVRISVTLDDLSVLASAEGDLRDAGWIPTTLTLAPTLNVADFQQVIDILGRPSFFLHYFAERGRFQRAARTFADEMDFLGCYLETGFDLGSLEKEKVALVLTGMSAPIDRYCNSRDAGVAIKKPQPKLSPYFLTLIGSIETRAFPRWSIVTTDLLRCASYEEQLKIDKLLVKLKTKVERNWRDPTHECSLVVSPPEHRDTAVVFYAYPPQFAQRRKEIAEELAHTALETSGRNRCVMICRNTARWDAPYASILIVSSAELSLGDASAS